MKVLLILVAVNPLLQYFNLKITGTTHRTSASTTFFRDQFANSFFFNCPDIWFSKFLL